MTEAQGLDVDAVVEINVDLCNETGEGTALLDAPGLEAALARPWSGFGEHEAFPTMYEKAAALLHGIAARQVFQNGNKRTAWVAATTFLELNGVDIGRVETVQSDMFVRAVALDHTLRMSDVAEWFAVAHRDNSHTGQAAAPIQRLRITQVGNVEPRPDGVGIDANSWRFESAMIPSGHMIDLEPVGVLGGWTAYELHAIAHGLPCQCEIGRVHSTAGPT